MIGRRSRANASWRLRARRAVRAIPMLAAAGAVTIVTAGAAGQLGPLNDLFAVGQGAGDSPAKVPIVHRTEPPSLPTPLAPCAPGSRQQPGVDGRVPAGSAKDGLSCNVTLLGHQGTEGGFKVFRYSDARGHECAFYDTTLMFPLNALNPGGGSAGVAVLDMSDPSHPVQTDTLTTPPMLSPHESVNLNPKRGLLAAVNGNLTTEPGLVAIYDAHADCRHPVLRSLSPVARFGHESGFSSDGKTFYATSTALQAITAIDVTDPDHPHAIWEGNIFSHGMSLSPDGNRAYIADPGTAPGGDSKANMLILDTSEIQARKSDPHAREISRLTWNSASIPQNAIPFTRDGKSYVLEFDEYTQATLHPDGDPDVVGAARIIDISDETKPHVVSNLRLAINQPAEHRAATEANDPGTGNPAQGYAAHYCNIPRAWTPGSSPARSSRPACASSTSRTSPIPRRSATSSRRRSLVPRTGTRPATTRCRSPHSCRNGARSGTATARAASTPCAWTRACGRRTRRGRRPGAARPADACSSRCAFPAAPGCAEPAPRWRAGASASSGANAASTPWWTCAACRAPPRVS